MFERYTEKARRVIFFARYEASQLHSPYIESEHLLLGLLREDKPLMNRVLQTHGSMESIRKQIEGHATAREKVATSVDLPLSNEGKRVLAYAAEEAERLLHKHIGPEHLLLGLLREEKCFAAEILQGGGVRLDTVRQDLTRIPHKEGREGPGTAAALPAFSRDLSQEAMDNLLDPLIGREEELQALMEILGTRKNNNPVLIGEHGVGKTAMVYGLAQRIADDAVPSFLAGKRILTLDLSLLFTAARFGRHFEDGLTLLTRELMSTRNSVIFIDDLRGTERAGVLETSLDTLDILRPALLRGDIQCVTGTLPNHYQEIIEKSPWFEHISRVVNIQPLNDKQTLQVLHGLRGRYEKYHAVSYTDDALECAAYNSVRYLPDRYLPGKAVDVFDAAGSRVKLRQSSLPDDMIEVRKRIRFLAWRMENAIANHEFEKARFYGNEERKEQENLTRLRKLHNIDESLTLVVERKDVEQVIARWTGTSSL